MNHQEWLEMLSLAITITCSLAGAALGIYIIVSVSKDVLAYRRRKARIVAVYDRTTRRGSSIDTGAPGDPE